ncbi:hypothetical protein CDAR_559151 [Caerostris darwini]|uniref:Uncharacterized protein n=1 Tax=Caerostris darwini TaxID=1538125 RepID=A0AAV4P2E1_9ARAC|nr:hypothetical protein CDAR_559151 [Caerostris darwini]
MHLTPAPTPTPVESRGTRKRGRAQVLKEELIPLSQQCHPSCPYLGNREGKKIPLLFPCHLCLLPDAVKCLLPPHAVVNTVFEVPPSTLEIT